MNIWVIFLRGINVGGNNLIKMADLRASLQLAGFEQVKTYIQSGNIVLRSDLDTAAQVERSIRDLLMSRHDLDVPVMVISPNALAETAARNPLGQNFEKPNWMFVSFLGDTPPSPDLETLRSFASPNEKLELTEQAFYFYAVDGAARSKVLMKAEKCLGVSATARNWRTIGKMLSILRDEYGFAA